MNFHVLTEPPTFIRYDFVAHPLGTLIVAATNVGICHVSFLTDTNTATNELQARFPSSRLQQDTLEHADFSRTEYNKELHVIGTNFQVKVWKQLCQIPLGVLVSYQDVARAIGRLKAVRAVGTAIAQNKIALLIPCHRVIRKSGELGNYRWGIERKKQLIAYERI